MRTLFLMRIPYWKWHGYLVREQEFKSRALESRGFYLTIYHMVPTHSTRTERETGKNRPEVCSILRDSFRLLLSFFGKTKIHGYPEGF